MRDERFRIKNGMKKIDKEKLPMPEMVGRIVVGYYEYRVLFILEFCSLEKKYDSHFDLIPTHPYYPLE
jgi:hypothetical protein